MGNAGDKHHAAQGGEYAQELPRGQPFVEQKGRGKCDKNRGHVIAEGSRGDGGIVVRLKERDPVEAHDDAGEHQQLQVGAEGLTLKGCFLPAEQQP